MDNRKPPPRAFHLLAKPIGPVCNLTCRYCYYLEKAALYPEVKNFRMSDEVLECFIRQYIDSQEVPEVEFGWQGGEPTLLGLDFFRKVIKLQQRYAGGKRIHNSLQTNATLLDDEWCAFLAEQDFLTGVSIDGPADLHNAFRVNRKGEAVFDRVLESVELLKKHGAEFNTLSCVNRLTGAEPLRVYRFLRQIGARFMQFIPLVERKPVGEAAKLGLDLNIPPELSRLEQDEDSPVTPWSVGSLQYGQFLSTIFDRWVRHDVGRFFVTTFDSVLANWMGRPGGICVHQPVCGRSLAIEHNGDLYSCDHYVYPAYRLGNIMDRSLVEMVESPQQETFGLNKYKALPKQCMQCPYRFACNGECPKQRFLTTADGEPGLSYLCEGMKYFLHHVDPHMQHMARLLREGRPASLIMDELAVQEKGSSAWEHAGRNEACPCGSGKKFKKCCGKKS